MSDKSFTSGERRGLILLLIVITSLLGVALFNRSCSERTPVNKLSSEAEAAHDSSVAVIDSVAIPEAKPKKKKKTSKNNRRPDGIKRDYLSEPIHE